MRRRADETLPFSQPQFSKDFCEFEALVRSYLGRETAQ